MTAEEHPASTVLTPSGRDPDDGASGMEPGVRRRPAAFSRADRERDGADIHIERRLAAILAADVAGYSRLVGADEHGTLRQWRAHWEQLIAPDIEQHHGRIVRINGDGILAEFASVVNAVRCAVALQRGMAERNADIPVEKRIEFRIGINVGDVIIDRGELWGEGVNVAARLEALADPGGICVSARVLEDVRGKLDVVFDDMGRRELKNIARPVRVYRARPVTSGNSAPAPPLSGARPAARGPTATSPRGLETRTAAADDAGPRPSRPTGRRLLFGILLLGFGSLVVGVSWWLTSPRSGLLARHLLAPLAEAVTTWSAGTPRAPALSIVVLPFVNLGGDAAQDYVADGITDSLTSDLSRALPGSFVVSRGTAFTYKSRPADPRQIGRELQVRYLLRGSVLPDGQKLRVNAQLVDTQDGSELWAERFDAERRSILDVQDEIVARLSRVVGLQIVDIEARRRRRESPSSAEVIDLVLRGKAALNRPSSPATMIEARDLFAQALGRQPADVDSLAGFATTLVFEFLNDYYETGGDERLRQAEALLDRALAAEPRHLMALKAKSALLRAQGRFEDAIEAAAAVIAENPGEPWAYKEIGLSHLYLGRAEEALDWFAKADRIGPRDPGRWTWLDSRGQSLVLLGRDEEAIRSLNGALKANPNSVASHAFLAAAYALTGRSGEARSALEHYLRLHPGARVSTFRRNAPVPLAVTSATYRRQRERLENGLRAAGMPE